ncbi:MAG: hypothetical protein PHS88_07235 [Candidatus Omnitrophica bacterium]|jgi:hypothetical protein|nr:hypothetical protein [Candidatus Omnitrophota bacterium]
MTTALKDTDIQEAIRCAHTCVESNRDSAFMRMASEVIPKDPELARALIYEIDDLEFKVSVLFELCLTTFDKKDVVLLGAAIGGLKKPETWPSVYRAVWFFANGQLSQAREACLDIPDILLLIKLRIFFARRTNAAIDKLLLDQTTDQLQGISDENAKELGEHIGHEFIFIAHSNDSYWVAKAAWLKMSRKARLERIIKLQAPAMVLANEIRMIAGTGLTDLALAKAEELKVPLDDDIDHYNHHFSIGYSRQCQVGKARELAEKIRDPERRSLAFVHLYLARLNN